MSDFAPGDLVQIVGVGQCAYGFAHRDHAAYAGKVTRVLSLMEAHPDWPVMQRVEVSIRPMSPCCAGCLRKLNDEPDNAELIAAIKRCRPMKTEQPA